MKKTKIAVCFFGHLRSYKKCAPFLRKNFLNYYDCDLFMHTWETLDHSTKTWHNLKKIEGSTNKDDIIKSYGKFNGIKIEKQNVEDIGVLRIIKNYQGKENTISIFGILSMFHSIVESINLQKKYSIEHNIKYNYILFIRPDIWIKNPLKIHNILDSLSDNQIQSGFFTFYNNASSAVSGFEDMSATDLVFFAKPETMTSIVDNLGSIKEKLKPDTIVPYCPEFIFIKLVRESGFIPYCIDFPMIKNWEIRRVSETLKLKKRIISLRIRKNLFQLWLFPKLMQRIIRVKFNLLGMFTVDFSIGDPS